MKKTSDDLLNLPINLLPLSSASLSDYAKIPIAFEVRSIYQVRLIDRGLGGIRLGEVAVEPYRKDYDACDEDRPENWLERFDVSNWVLLMILDGEIPLAGAAIAFDTPEVHMLEGRRDLAIVWDIRVCPDQRGNGLGTSLFQAAATWARSKGCTQLKVETQNTNVPACKFYARQGCSLGEIHRFKYIRDLDFTDEVMLVWYLDF
jgi:GNAT superfamily N-acetyltransferase